MKDRSQRTQILQKVTSWGKKSDGDAGKDLLD